MPYDDPVLKELGGYLKAREPDVRERADAWATAIGLQKVDGLTPSGFLLETAKLHIEGKITQNQARRRIRDYYAAKDEREKPDPAKEEPDKVSERISAIINDGAFEFTPEYFISIHAKMFKGVLSAAGRLRTYNIRKHEWVLREDSVTYGSADTLKASLVRDFKDEPKGTKVTKGIKGTKVTKGTCWLFCLLCLLRAWGLSAADAPVEPPRRSVAEVLKTLPKSQTSSDGFVTVVAADVPGDEIGFRGPLVQFASGVVRSLGKTLSIPELPRRREASLIIVAQDGRTNDTRVVVRVTRRKSGPLTRIWLPSPGYSDIAQLRFEVAKAYFRAAVENFRELPPPPGALPPAELPEWLVDGALRQTDLEQARADMRSVLEGWSSGYFPFFPSLCAQTNMPSVLAGYLAGWLKEKALYKALLMDYAAGRAWRADDFAEQLTGCTEAARQDAASDRRLLRLLRKVISPGRAAFTDLRIFASRLLLYPPFYDKMFPGCPIGCTFREAVTLASEDLEVRRAAARKAQEIPLHAIGRGEELQQASLAYRDFLVALAEGDSSDHLTALLDAADAKLALAEEAVRKREEENR